MPDIAPIGDSSGSAPMQANSTTLAQLAMPNITLPSQTVPVHNSNPNVPQPAIRQPDRNTNQGPITSQVADVKHARRQNAFNGLINSVNNFSKNLEQKKLASITHDIKTMLDGQTQIDNAQTILQNPNASPQDKKNAQGVLERNKTVMESIMTDPKRRKNIQKAFDVSFTDPEKNNTPEIKAMTAAKQQHEQSVKDGMVADNKQEAQVDQAANGGGGGQEQGRRMITSGDHQSTTPYADQFLKSQPTALAPNPAYAAAQKTNELTQKNAGKALPTAITAESNERRTVMTTQAANERAENLRKTQIQIATARNLTALREANLKAITVIRSVQMRITSNEKIATQRLTDPRVVSKLMDQNVKLYGTLMNSAGQHVQQIQKLIQATKTDPLIKTEEERSAIIDQYINGQGGLKEWQGNYSKYANEADQAQTQLRALTVGGNNGGFADQSRTGFDSTSGASDPFTRIQNSLAAESSFLLPQGTTDGNSQGSDDEGDDEVRELSGVN